MEFLKYKLKNSPQEFTNNQRTDISLVNFALQKNNFEIMKLLIMNGFDFNEEEKKKLK